MLMPGVSNHTYIIMIMIININDNNLLKTEMFNFVKDELLLQSETMSLSF